MAQQPCTQSPLRMGRIGYLNVLPIYYPLESGRIAHEFELVSAPPAVLNTMMSRGELHISSTSCFEYAQNPDQYYLIKDLSIGSRGPVMSVLLLSSCPIEKLEGADILITGETATSSALLKLLLRQKYGIHATYTVGNVSQCLATGKAPKAFLAIGDEALRLRHHEAYPYRLDLAEGWRHWTGLPFIFGLWVVSRKAADAKLFTQDPTKLFHEARAWSFANMDVILDITQHGCPVSREELSTYYHEGLLYTLQGDEIEGLRLFYDKLAEEKVISASPALEFYNFS